MIQIEEHSSFDEIKHLKPEWDELVKEKDISLTFDWMYSLEGLFGLIVFVVVGYIMFYAGQWGGGDSKLLMGLGALIGLKLTLNPLPVLLIFLINYNTCPQ